MLLKAISVVLGLTVIAGATAAAEPTRTPLDWAELLVQNVKPDDNEYIYKPISVTWAGQHGAAAYANHADCSGFYTLLLEQSYGWDGDRFKKWLGSKRPLAHTWHAAVVDQKGFKRILLVKDLKRGDVIAVKYEAGAQKDTGHVMLVAGEPRARKETDPIEPGTRQWEVSIIDSSKSGHGADDTRRQPDKTFHTGVGKGVLRVYSDDRGEFTGYAWSTMKASTYQSAEKHPIAAGRLDLDFKP